MNLECKRTNTPEIKNKYLYASAAILIIYTLLPITRLLPDIIKGLIVVASFILFLAGAYNSGLKNNTFQNIIFLLVLIGLLCSLIYIGEFRYSKRVTFISRMLVYIVFWLPFLIVYSYSYNMDYVAVAKLKKLALGLLIVTATTTLIGLFIFDEASRLLADGDLQAHRIYQLYNIGGYGFIYAITLVLPALIHDYKVNRKKRLLFIILLFLCCIIKSYYVFAICFALFELIVGVLIIGQKSDAGRKKALVWFVITAAFILLILFTKTFWDIVLELTKGNRTLYVRFSNIADIFLNQKSSGDIKYRLYLYAFGWDAFVKNPFGGNVFGGSFEQLSGHSEILDLLGGTGLIGLILLIVILGFIKRGNRNRQESIEVRLTYFLAIFMLFVLSLLNTTFSSAEIAIVVTFMYISTEKREVKNVTVHKQNVTDNGGNGLVWQRCPK